MLAALPLRQSQTCHSPSLRCCLLLTKHSFLQVTCCPIVRHSLQPTGSEACQGQRRCMLYRQHLLDDVILGDARTAFSSAAVILKKPHKYILAGPWCNRRSFCCPLPDCIQHCNRHFQKATQVYPWWSLVQWTLLLLSCARASSPSR